MPYDIICAGKGHLSHQFGVVLARRRGSFADLEASGQRRRERREGFPGQTGAIVPRGEWVAPVEPHHPDGRRGGRPVGCERMPGTCLPRVWSRLSDEACEDAVPGPGATRRLVGIDVTPGQVPDATTLPEFRHLPGGEGLGEGMLAEPVPVPGGRGIITRGGPVVDATLAGSPSPAGSRGRSRDPGAHQARRGDDRHLGHEAHAGVDAGTGLARTAGVTAASVSDVAVAPSPPRPDDGSRHADAGHAGIGKRPEVRGDPAPSGVGWRVARRRPGVPGRDHPEVSWERGTGSSPSRVRSRAGRPLHAVKDLLGPGRTKRRGPGRTATSPASPSRSRTSPCSRRREGPWPRPARRGPGPRAMPRRGRGPDAGGPARGADAPPAGPPVDEINPSAYIISASLGVV